MKFINILAFPSALPMKTLIFKFLPAIAVAAIIVSNQSSLAETIEQKNALRQAKSHLEYTAFSRDGLVKQLEFSKFDHEDAVWAADNVGANWREQAVRQAKSYLDYSAFSRDGLVKQLKHSKFDHKDAVFAADNCGADWNEQAVRQAKSYLEYTAFSRDGLVKQLKFSGFTSEQATHAVDAVGFKPKEASKKATSKKKS